MQTGMENCLRMDIINFSAKTNFWIRSMWRLMCKSVGCPSMNCVLATPPVSTCPTAFVSFYPSFRAITNIHWQQSRHQAPHCSKENFSQVRYSQYQFICGNKIFVVSKKFPAAECWSVWAVWLLLTGAQWNTSPGQACQVSQYHYPFKIFSILLFLGSNKIFLVPNILSTMEYFLRTSLSSLSISLPF